jgi:hypothetical protein
MFNGQGNTVVEVDNHMLWHAKNLWVLIVFEQGWVGLLLFNALLLYTLTILVMSFKEGNLFSLVLLSSLIGFLTVGIIGSLFDSPRMATFFFFVVFVSIFNSGMTLTMCKKDHKII